MKNIAVVMSDGMYAKMFRPTDIDLLRPYARISGPVDLSRPAELEAALATADIVLAGWGSPSFKPELLDQAPNLKYVAYSAGTIRYLVGDEFFRRGIRISSSAAANAVPVAQFTVSQMVWLLKQGPWLSLAYTACDDAEVNRRRTVVKELQGISVGIIGASRVGREVIRLLKSYPNLTIRLYDPYVSKEQAQQMGVTLCSLDEACQCEVVSIHAPDIAETRHMINARILALMPDHAVLINTARGALVDEAALVAEVGRRPLYVALDVTDPEPPTADSPLRKEKNIILTPHIAGAMNQACLDMGRMAVDEARRFMAGEKLQHEITQAMLAKQA